MDDPKTQMCRGGERERERGGEGEGVTGGNYDKNLAALAREILYW